MTQRQVKERTMRTSMQQNAGAARTKEDPDARAGVEFGVPADAYRSDAGHRSSRSGVIAFRVLVAALAFVLVIGVFALAVPGGAASIWAVVTSAIVFAAVFASVHVAQSWERFVILRLGRYNRLGGPGLFFTIPAVEYCTLRIDQRTHITPFGAEETLASDMIPLDVDAVLSWVIWDPEAACTEVEDVNFAVMLAAQTALRDAIGRAAASEVVMRRNQLDQEIRGAIEEKVSDWGVTVLSVEIRNIVIPQPLQDTMAQTAQAERRRDARLMLMESERTIAELLHDAADVYRADPIAYNLRKMHLVHEGMMDENGSLVVPAAYTQGFVDNDNTPGAAPVNDK